MTDTIQTVGIIGAGFMGSQIASRAAIFGYRVKIYDSVPQALESSPNTIAFFTDNYFQRDGVSGDPKETTKRITFHNSLEDALDGVDFIVEAVTENLEVKKAVFSQIDRIAKENALIATNSSSLPVSRIEDAVARKDKVINTHFYSPIADLYFVDIVRGNRTSQKTLDKTVSWIKSIKCMPLVAKKECIGFVFNRVWHAARRDALKAWAEDYADFKDIDRAWRLFTGMLLGPFGIMDYIGLDVVYSVQNLYYEESGDPYLKPPQALKDMVDRGDLGMKTGKGFYTWPNPECLSPDFLKVDNDV
ncbi:MAG: 3-hydroxyacyl-CoA dehydrogenase family protein [Deltaproteobacteria bacterium]|nr:3-hydroxyacyl-CoA dehydrogenase family protein [Deltaproteobacteria bacterium]